MKKFLLLFILFIIIGSACTNEGSKVKIDESKKTKETQITYKVNDLPKEKDIPDEPIDNKAMVVTSVKKSDSSNLQQPAPQTNQDNSDAVEKARQEYLEMKKFNDALIKIQIHPYAINYMCETLYQSYTDENSTVMLERAQNIFSNSISKLDSLQTVPELAEYKIKVLEVLRKNSEDLRNFRNTNAYINRETVLNKYKINLIDYDYILIDLASKLGYGYKRDQMRGNISGFTS